MSRRSTLRWVGALAVGVLLTACSSDREPQPAPAVPAAPRITDAAFDGADDAAAAIEAALPRRYGPAQQLGPEHALQVGEVQFTRGSARLALAELGLDPPAALDAAIALYAIGAGGASSELPLLLERFDSTDEVQRAAALLAVGELRGAPIGPVVARLKDDAPLVRKAAAYALAIRGGPALEPLDPQLAAELTAFLADPVAAPRDAMGDLYLALRFEAAKRFGLVQGQSYRLLRIEELAADGEFLDALVLPLAGRLRSSVARDHLLSLLLEQPSALAIDTAATAMPQQLDALVANGLWQPADDAEWEALVAALEREGVDATLASLLEQAQIRFSDPLRSARLLLEAGLEGGYEVLEPQLRDSDAKSRVQAVRALGSSGDPVWLAELERADTDSNDVVRAAALVGRLALGDTRVSFAIDTSLGDPEDALHLLLLRELTRDEEVGSRGVALLERAYPTLEGPIQLRAACSLAEHGRREPRELLYEALARRTAGALSARAVRALGGLARAADIELFARLFPSEDPELDLALAHALVESQHPLGIQLLRAALWAPQLERGLLAAHLMAEFGGVQVLHEELEAPPPRITSDDLRRLGFALGEIGGVSEFTKLSRSRSSADPVLQGAYIGAMTSRTR